MHGTLPRSAVGTIATSVRPDSERISPVQSDSDDSAWFVAPARDLLGSDPGFALHWLTGISESSGYRYARGERGVPGGVLRRLLRSPHGRQWLNAIMDGSDEAWWLDHQRAERIAEQIDQMNLD